MPLFKLSGARKMVRGVLVDGAVLTEADMEIGEDRVPMSDLVGMPLRVRKLDGLCSSEPYLISQFMGEVEYGGMSSVDWNYGGMVGVAPQVFVARADNVPFLPEDFDRCLEKLEASACALSEDESDHELEEASVCAFPEDENDHESEESEDDAKSIASGNDSFGKYATREFRKLLSNDFLPSRTCAFAQVFGMASQDDSLNSFVFGLWTRKLKSDREVWSAVAALEGPEAVPALFDTVYANVARQSEENLRRKNLIRFSHC